jgi:hypothetical protein
MTSLLSDITPINDLNPPDLEAPWLLTVTTKEEVVADTSMMTPKVTTTT